MTVRAAVLSEAPGDLNVIPVNVDDELEAGEVRVRVAACGLCHSDLHLIDGELPSALPTVPGHELSGVVAQVGPGVRHVAVGDHVVACLSMACGTCAQCRSGRPWLCAHSLDIGRAERPRPKMTDSAGREVFQFAGLGGLAEEVIVPGAGLVAIDPAMPLDLAAPLGCAVLTGVGSAVKGAGVRPGERVVVIGCGGVGLNVIQGARIAGAARIVAVDLNPDKLAVAFELGATAGVGPGDDQAAEIMAALGGPADHAFDVVGSSPTLTLAVQVIAPGRTAWLVGIPAGRASFEIPALQMLMRGKGIRGLLMGNNRFQDDIPVLVEHYRAGRLRLDRLVSDRIPLERAGEAYRRMRRGDPGARTVVTFPRG